MLYHSSTWPYTSILAIKYLINVSHILKNLRNKLSIKSTNNTKIGTTNFKDKQVNNKQQKMKHIEYKKNITSINDF